MKLFYLIYLISHFVNSINSILKAYKYSVLGL